MSIPEGSFSPPQPSSTADAAGNILTKTEHVYTTAETAGTATDTIYYGHGYSYWGDALTKHDGKYLTYDDVGNPLTDNTYTWENGRRLASMTTGTGTWNFTYNADGLRTKRTDVSTTYTYEYAEGQLTKMTIGTTTLRFTYDANGRPASLNYDGTNYYYVLDLQGDVVAILNGSGTAVTTYTYDSWGQVLTATGSLNYSVGQNNPLRYRGYVYDTETGLYYLQSRYYDPELGRFLNADGYSTTGQGFVGNNMFAYCLNNPVILYDSSGQKAVALPWWSWAVPIISIFDGPLPCLDAIALTLVFGNVAICCTSSSAEAEVKSEAATAENTSSKGIYSVYFLCAANDSSKTIIYVGRVKTANMASRMSYHKSRGRALVYSIDGLHYDECRAVEQAGMILHHSINRNDPIKNQIRGVSPRNKNGSVYFSAGMEFAYSDRYQNTREPLNKSRPYGRFFGFVEKIGIMLIIRL